MKLVLLVGYNNYFNRIFKKETLVSDYESLADSYYEFTKINFVPNDNISTTQLINYTYVQGDPQPDYLLVCDEETNAIVSRWFVMETTRTRGCQWKIDLRRDVLADHIDSILQAPIFVQRAMLGPGDPFIVNDEGMKLNKIKKSETLMYDASAQGWLVGYFTGEWSGSISVTNAAPTEYLTIQEAASLTGLSESFLTDLMAGLTVPAASGWQMRFNYVNAISLTGAISQASMFFSSDMSDLTDSGSSIMNLPNHNNLITSLYEQQVPGVGAALSGSNAATSLSRFKAISSISQTIDEIRKLENLSKPIQYDGKIWRIQGISAVSSASATINNVNDPTIIGLISAAGYSVNNSGQFRLVASKSDVSLVKVLDTNMNLTITMGGSSKPRLKNRPYRMFCIPTGKYRWRAIKPTEEDPNPTYDDLDGKDYAFKLAAEIQRQASDVAKLGIIDLQYLPYFPLRQYIHENTFAVDRYYFVIAGYAMNSDMYDELQTIPNNENESPTTVLHVFYCDVDSFSFTNKVAIKVDDAKFASNCDMYRLCSPNYQGSFDFNAAKNGGVSGFTFSCTYKPYTPYIRVAPIFNWLYGEEYNDQRGLICGGNFSMSQSTSAWEQFQLNNKNYQNIFNREIQSLDLQQDIQRFQVGLSAVTGTIQQGVSGAQTGAMVGGPWGAAIGAAVGTTLGAFGGAADYAIASAQMKDQKDLQIEKYNYQLGNIRAIPNTITKVDAFDISSKVFPFLEYYTCTEEEKEAFEKKIEFESMIVMRIGKLADYVSDGQKHFFQGDMIRNLAVYDDCHVLNEIRVELLKGVYI